MDCNYEINDFCDEQPSEDFSCHDRIEFGEVRYYQLDCEADVYFHSHFDEQLEKYLDEFERILNYGKAKDDPSWLRVVFVNDFDNCEISLVGKDTLENRLRYEEQGKNILAYIVHRILLTMQSYKEWGEIVPADTLRRLIESSMDGNVSEIEQELERLKLVYQSDEDRDMFDGLIRRVQGIENSYLRLGNLVPVETFRDIVFFALNGDMRELETLLRHLQKAYPSEFQELNLRDILCQVQLRKERSQDEGTSSSGKKKALAEGTRPFDTLVYRLEKTQALSELCLHDDVLTSVRLFMDCYDHREELERENLPCGSRILLAGPPGNGKTALAGAIAKEMGLPIYFFDMANVRDGHIGAMSRNVDTAFCGVSKKGAAILFLDECDSMAGQRLYEHGADREDSAGLNSILTNLDRLGHDTVVIAATNHPDELDDAFKRRFNETIWLAPPSVDDALRYVERYQEKHHVRFSCSVEEQKTALKGKPWSKVVEFCQTLHRNQIIGRSERFPIGWTGKCDIKKAPMGFRQQ